MFNSFDETLQVEESFHENNCDGKNSKVSNLKVNFYSNSL